ncbi:hypothetical protein [Lysinibacillus sp. UBA6686]|nr:hypothetical protein [Lysinibacillus sp. UBA6686]
MDEYAAIVEQSTLDTYINYANKRRGLEPLLFLWEYGIKRPNGF